MNLSLRKLLVILCLNCRLQNLVAYFASKNKNLEVLLNTYTRQKLLI